jgi:hypothetical protein
VFENRLLRRICGPKMKEQDYGGASKVVIFT